MMDSKTIATPCKDFPEHYKTYTQHGLKALKCAGHHPQYNTASTEEDRYRRAKQPIMTGWTAESYKSLTIKECKAWEAEGGWIGWVLPPGIVVLDVDHEGWETKISTIKKICKKYGLRPPTHKSNDGRHVMFRSDKDISPKTALTKCGIEVTYRVGGKSQLILAPINGRSWQVSLNGGPLPELPDELTPHDANVHSQECTGIISSSCITSSSFIKNNSLYKERNNPTSDMFANGRRDEDLFSVANVLTKGGMPPEQSLQVLKNIAKSWGEEDQEKWFSEKIKSALKRQEHREINLTDEILKWISVTERNFSVTDCYMDIHSVTGVTNRNSIRVILNRLKDRGIIKPTGMRDGEYRRITNEYEEMDIVNVSTEAHPLKLPLRLRELVKIAPRNIIVAAGAKSAGKTAFLMNTAYLNRDFKKGVFYYNSEMSPEEIRMRIDEFGEDAPLSEWKKIKFIPLSGNWGDAIKRNPDAIHIVDYLEITDKFYEIGAPIREIYDAMKKGVCLIGIQKKAGQPLGYGGSMSIEKARLYLSLDYGVITITDAKLFAKRDVNPRGLQNHYKLVGGCKYAHESGWLTPEEYNGKSK